jgi:hypothetical protein
VFCSCCWRTWTEYSAAAESNSKGFVSKEEFNKSLEKQASTRIRDSRDLEAFWSAFCSSSEMLSDDAVECNLRFFREGVQPSWEGSGAHGKFTYSTKKRYTKVKLFALIRTAVLEVRPSPPPSFLSQHLLSVRITFGSLALRFWPAAPTCAVSCCRAEVKR